MALKHIELVRNWFDTYSKQQLLEPIKEIKAEEDIPFVPKRKNKQEI